MSALPNSREPLVRYLEAQTVSDAEMRILLRDAAKEAEAIMLNKGAGIGADVRRAQLDIAAAQQEMWKKVGYQAEINIGDAADAASESMSLMMDTFMNSLGYTSEGMRHAIMAQGRQGIEALISRRTDGIPLSQRVYSTSVAVGGQLDRTVNAMILNGASAREIASRVKGFIDPATPGGSSYAAMRLGRTELNNAFHETSIRLNNDNPFVSHIQWHLSGSHPIPDECDDYASRVNFPGGDPGVFNKSDVPGKPHPQCLCHIGPVVVSDDEFVKNFHNGSYDNYIDNKLGCQRA